MERDRREMSDVIGLRRRALEEWFWHATLKYRRGPFSGAARPRCKRAQVHRAWIREVVGRSRLPSWAAGCAPSSRRACRSSIFRSCEVQGLTWGEDSSHGGRPARSLRPGPPYSAPGHTKGQETLPTRPGVLAGQPCAFSGLESDMIENENFTDPNQGHFALCEVHVQLYCNAPNHPKWAQSAT